jgi:hypothetical protein
MKIKVNYKCDEPSLNGRIYPSDMMREAIAEFIKLPLQPVCTEIRYFGRNGVDLSKVAGNVETIELDEDNNFIVDVRILDTPMGDMLNLLKEDTRMMLTTAGHGYLGDDKKTVQGFKLFGFAVTYE